MSLLFFTKGDKSVGSSRQRAWLLAEHLRRSYGLESEVLHPRMEGFGSFIFLKQAIARHDILIVHKSLFSWKTIIAILYGRFILGKSLIYDLDDVEWIHSRLKTILLARCANMVFAGSHVIFEWARGLNDRVEFIPTSLDHELYKEQAVYPERRDVYTFVWVGTGTGHFRFGNLDILGPVFEALHRRGLKFRFVVVGAQKNADLKRYFSSSYYESIFIDTLVWDREGVVAETFKKYKADVGLSPSKDSPFERGKCAFKSLEYMACGLPVVASSMGENKYVVRNGVSGILAGTVEEWTVAIIKICDDLELRKKMGNEGLRIVAETYSYSSIIPKIAAAIDEIIIHGRRVNQAMFEHPGAVERYKKDTKLRKNEKWIIDTYFKKHGSRVLVLGCGAGRTLMYFLEKGFRATGLDISKNMLDACRDNLKERELSASLIEGDAADLSFAPDESYDYVFFPFHGIDFVYPRKNRERVFSEARRVLKPGGVFVFSTHNIFYWKYVLRFLFGKRDGMYVREAIPYGSGVLFTHYSNFLSTKRYLKHLYSRVEYIGDRFACGDYSLRRARTLLYSLKEKSIFLISLK